MYIYIYIRYIYIHIHNIYIYIYIRYIYIYTYIHREPKISPSAAMDQTTIWRTWDFEVWKGPGVSSEKTCRESRSKRSRCFMLERNLTFLRLYKLRECHCLPTCEMNCMCYVELSSNGVPNHPV